MFNTDRLFAEYDKDLFTAYKKADLLSGEYSGFLDKILSRNTKDVPHEITKFANPIGMIVSGPASNIAGRYRNYIVGNDDFLPLNRSVYNTKVPGFKPVKPPSTKDLATGAALEATLDALYPS